MWSVESARGIEAPARIPGSRFHISERRIDVHDAESALVFPHRTLDPSGPFIVDDDAQRARISTLSPFVTRQQAVRKNPGDDRAQQDRKSTRLNSSHSQ